MIQEMFLWILLVIYQHVLRFFELNQNVTGVYNFKTYIRYSGKIVYIILFTQVLILLGYWLLKYGG